jgi:hypothetical protein
MSDNVITGDNLNELGVNLNELGVNVQDESQEQEQCTAESLGELTKAKLIELAESKEIKIDKTAKKEVIISEILKAANPETEAKPVQAKSKPKGKIYGISVSDRIVYH